MNAAYRIEVRGRVSDRMLGPYVDEFVISRTRRSTTLSGHIRDPAHLHGVVAHLTGIGLVLVSVVALDDGGDVTDLADSTHPAHGVGEAGSP